VLGTGVEQRQRTRQIGGEGAAAPGVERVAAAGDETDLLCDLGPGGGRERRHPQIRRGGEVEQSPPTGGEAGDPATMSELVRAHRAIEVTDLVKLTEVLAAFQWMSSASPPDEVMSPIRCPAGAFQCMPSARRSADLQHCDRLADPLGAVPAEDPVYHRLIGRVAESFPDGTRWTRMRA
jgi:hypothetical protein